MKQPVRGGLKGGRRSVKRGQSVEFADYRDYALGDDLRQLDWNVYARLEKLFVKLFIEEEDVTITFLLDASPSMAFGRPEKLLFAKRAAAALGYIALAGEDRVVVTALTGRTARRQGGLRGSGRVFRLLANLSTIQPAAGATDLLASARHAAAMLPGRGVIVLISDLLDPAADRVIRELAATGSELIVLHVLSPEELDPPLEGDLRLVDSESGEGIDVTVDLATLDDYRARLACVAGGPGRPRRQAPCLVRADLQRHAPGGPRVRRAAPPPGRRVGPGDAVPRPACARRAAVRAGRRRHVPAQAPPGRGRGAVHAAVAQAGRRRRGERTVAEAPPEPAAAPPAPPGPHPGAPRGSPVRGAAGGSRRRHRARAGHLRVDAGDRRRAEPARGGQGAGARGPQGAARGRQGQRDRGRDAPPGWSPTARRTWGT